MATRQESLQARHERLAAKVGVPTPGGPARPSGGGRSLVIKVAPGVVLLAALLLGGLVWLRSRQGAGADDALAAAGEKYREAVGLVVATGFDEAGRELTVPLATAWGYAPGLAATNAHVAMQAGELAAAGARIHIVVNGRPDLRLPVLGVLPHGRFLDSLQAEAADAEVPFAYDVALLVVDGRFPVDFPVAEAAELARLKSGYRVAYLGFPMENLVAGNVNPANPVATMQSGIVAAVTDFEQGDAGAAGNLLVRHNLGVTGGASGSPLFNARGQVVAVVNGMNIVAQLLPDAEGRPELARAPSAAMVNFAQRVDLLAGLVGQRPVVLAGGGRQPAAAAAASGARPESPR